MCLATKEEAQLDWEEPVYRLFSSHKRLVPDTLLYFSLLASLQKGRSLVYIDLPQHVQVRMFHDNKNQEKVKEEPVTIE